MGTKKQADAVYAAQLMAWFGETPESVEAMHLEKMKAKSTQAKAAKPKPVEEGKNNTLPRKKSRETG